MSLINVAERVRGPRTLTRTVLTVLTVAVAIIAGLLAMHSFNSHATTAGHHDTVAVSTQANAPDHHHDASTASQMPTPTAPAADAGCATCGGGDSMAWMACVLALLVATILLARIRLGLRHMTVASLLSARTAHPPVRAHTLPPPPSLTVLCISRT